MDIARDTAAPPARATEPPLEIRLSSDHRCLTLVWADGRRDALTAPGLRAHSQSAGDKRLRLSGLDVPARGDLTLTKVSLLGGYGLNLAFSDGHDRGIYPWALLQEIASQEIAGQQIAGAPRTPANAIP